jgi:hypothetical protein
VPLFGPGRYLILSLTHSGTRTRSPISCSHPSSPRSVRLACIPQYPVNSPRSASRRQRVSTPTVNLAISTDIHAIHLSIIQQLHACITSPLPPVRSSNGCHFCFSTLLTQHPFHPSCLVVHNEFFCQVPTLQLLIRPLLTAGHRSVQATRQL